MQYISDNAKDLLEEMLEDNAFFRLSVDEVLQHPWFAESSIDGIQNVVYEEMNNRLEYIKASQKKSE